MLSIQQILNRIQLGIDLNQVTFNEGAITFLNLQSLDHLDNPQFYNDMSETSGESSTLFCKDTQREVEVEGEHQIEGEDSQAPL